MLEFQPLSAEEIELSNELSNIDEPLRPLWNWQQQGIDFGRNKHHVGFFMDKRLGKIRVATHWAIERNFKRILVCAPLSACPGWQDELLRDRRQHCFLYGSKPQRLKQLIEFENNFRETGLFNQSSNDLSDDDAAESNHNNDPYFCIINPQGLFTARHHASKQQETFGTNLPQLTEIAKLPWDCIIWDESTNLKNPESQTNQIAHLAFSGAQNDHLGRCILSGEPAPEGPLDLFEQLKWLNGGFFMGTRNFWKWRATYFEQSGYEWYPKPGTLKLIKESVNAKCFTLSRKDAGIHHAPPYFERIRIDFPPSLRKTYDDAELHFELPQQIKHELESSTAEAEGVARGEAINTTSASLASLGQRETKFAVVVDNWLSQLCGGYPKDFPNLWSTHKSSFLLNLLKEQFPKDQVVIAFRFNTELFQVAELIRTNLQPTKTTQPIFATLTGATPPSERRNVQNRFDQGHLQFILGQIRVLQFGIDLSAARTMIRYSVPPTYEIISQSKDRIIHATKTDPVSYIDLCVNDSVDEDTLNALGEKEITARYFMNRLNLFKFKRLNLKQNKQIH